MEVKIEEGWKNHLSEEFEKPYFRALTQKVRQDYADPTVRVYPPVRRFSRRLMRRRLMPPRWSSSVRILTMDRDRRTDYASRWLPV